LAKLPASPACINNNPGSPLAGLHTIPSDRHLPVNLFQLAKKEVAKHHEGRWNNLQSRAGPLGYVVVVALGRASALDLLQGLDELTTRCDHKPLANILVIE
jgi:hypothetical protein